MFLLTLAMPAAGRASLTGMAITLFGVFWVGMAIAHAILLRELDARRRLHRDVLIGTFVGDTGAYFAGRSWGRRPLAPRISPNKTVEGLLGGIAGGTFAVWVFKFGYQDWIPGGQALLIGFASRSRRRWATCSSRSSSATSTSRTRARRSAHGGALDRLDAVFFTR